MLTLNGYSALPTKAVAQRVEMPLPSARDNTENTEVPRKLQLARMRPRSTYSRAAPSPQIHLILLSKGILRAA
jgi:hypothetical protein